MESQTAKKLKVVEDFFDTMLRAFFIAAYLAVAYGTCKIAFFLLFG